MGQRRDRPIGRPRRPRLPDPGDPKLRAWVIGRDPPAMHREVCARLRTRGFIEREAITQWTWAGFPGWPADQSEMPPTLRLRLAERLTIESPQCPLGWRLVPLLPPGALVDSPPVPTAPTIDTLDQLRTRDLLSAFQRALVREWWRPLDSDADFLTEYERLREISAARRTPTRTVWQRLGVPDDSRGLLFLEEKRYRLPTLEVRCRNPKPEPAEAAALILEANGHGNERSIRRRLTLARTARKVRAAWIGYQDWLCTNPRAWAELEQVLPSMTRDVASPSASLSSPPAPERPARGPS